MIMAVDQELLDGFNAGYIIEQYRPALAQKLIESIEVVDHPFFQGLKEGSKEYVRERELSLSKGTSKLKKFGNDIPRPTQRREKDNKEKGFDLEK